MVRICGSKLIKSRMRVEAVVVGGEGSGGGGGEVERRSVRVRTSWDSSVMDVSSFSMRAWY